MRLLPREEKFFAYFEQQANYIIQSATVLAEGVERGGSHVAEAAAKIGDLEQQADSVIHEAMMKLNSTFITPLDPEDIHMLSSHLDDVVDGIEEAAYRIHAYNVDPIPTPVKEICRILVKCGQSLQLAFAALAKNTPMLDHCIQVNKLEGEVDQISRKAVAELFRNEKDPIQLIKLKEVYEILEKTSDYAEDVADVLQEVAVKNS